MNYSITKSFPNFASVCFRQWRASSHCRFLHGYALSAAIVITRPTLDDNNWVFDFGAFDKFRQDLIQRFDHKLIAAESDPQLDVLRDMHKLGLVDLHVLPEVSMELFSHVIYGMFLARINHLPYWQELNVRVAVSEHSENCAVYGH